MVFENEASCNNYIELHPFFRKNGYVSYECSVCHKWHLGKSLPQPLQGRGDFIG